jgi:hypothetical protein
MNSYAVLVKVVVGLHLLWAAWVLLGWIVARGRPWLMGAHIASVCYLIVIELLSWPPCPLNVAETWLEKRAGLIPSRDSFVLRVGEAVSSRKLSESVVTVGAIFVCILILGIYVKDFLRRPSLAKKG